MLPNRPVNQIAVDRSNWRIAYFAYGGFAAATPSNRGHVFATTDGGLTFTDVTSNLPDVPVNSVVIDPTDSNTLYVGTDVGTFVSTNGGKDYKRLGDGMPKVATWQLDYDATNGVLLAGTHGRGAYTLQNRDASAALVVSKSDSGNPSARAAPSTTRSPSRTSATPQRPVSRITDPLPPSTTFQSADQGGRLRPAGIRWTGLTIPAGGQVQVHFAVQISPSLAGGTKAIVNDGITVKADGASPPPAARTPPRSPPPTPSR